MTQSFRICYTCILTSLMTFSLFSSGFLKLVFFFLFFYLKLWQGSWASKNFIICLVIKPASPIHISIPFPIHIPFPICQRLQCSRKDICVTRKFPMPATCRQHSHSHSHFILYFLFFEFFFLGFRCAQFPMLPSGSHWLLQWLLDFSDSA